MGLKLKVIFFGNFKETQPQRLNKKGSYKKNSVASAKNLFDQFFKEKKKPETKQKKKICACFFREKGNMQYDSPLSKNVFENCLMNVSSSKAKKDVDCL